MKKLFVILIVAMLITTAAFADLPDFISMSFDELQTMKTALDKEYNSRPESFPRILYSGRYIVDEDIPAGDYTITVTKMPETDRDGTKYALYKDLEGFETVRNGGYAKTIIQDEMYFGDTPKVLTLESGEVLYISTDSLTIASPGTDLLAICEYEPPEQTYVPAGDYHVPGDIPKGTYRVFAKDPKVLRFGIYHSEEKYTANSKYHSNEDEYFKFFVSKSTPYTTIILKDGYVLYSEKDLIMQKQPDLSFDNQ